MFVVVKKIKREFKDARFLIRCAEPGLCRSNSFALGLFVIPLALNAEVTVLVLNAELAIQHPQGPRVLADATLLQSADSLGPRAAAGATGLGATRFAGSGGRV